MRYIVKLGGVGLKLKFIDLEKEQFDFLKKSNLEKGEISIRDLSKYLNKDLNVIDSNFGISWGSHYIKVFEDDDELWHSDYDDEFEPQDEWINLEKNFKYSLLIIEYKEDEFYSFDLDTFEEFDPNNFLRVTQEFGNSNDIIIDLKYKNKTLQKTYLNNFENTLTLFKLYKNK